MSARVDVSVAAASSPAPSTSAPSGRVFIVGQTQRGPSIPTLIRGLADYRAVFGGRTGGAAVYDAVKAFFAEGGAEAYVLRGLGASPVKATVSIDTGKIVVTAKAAGAFANAFTAAWTSSPKTLAVVTDRGTETYTGETAAELIADAASSDTVTVTSSGTLPSSNVTATALAGGTDDFANIVWANAFALPADLGSGALITPGVPHGTAGAAAVAHAEATGRTALLTTAADVTIANAATAVDTVAAYPGSEHAVLLWPHLVHADGIVADASGYAAGVRARAIAAGGAGQSPIANDLGSSRSGITPATASSDAEWAAANTAGLSVVRIVGARTRLYSWLTVKPFGGTANLRGAQFRDLLNELQFRAAEVAEGYVGRKVDAQGRALSSFGADLEGLLAVYAASGALYGRSDAASGEELDPGYVVDASSNVNTSEALAAGRITAAISVRLSPTTEFVSITITAGDAGTTF